jgi:hypothetical protein
MIECVLSASVGWILIIAREVLGIVALGWTLTYSGLV